MDEAARIVNELKAGKVYPIYFLMGDEPYFIDRLSEYMENHLLPEEDRGFNQTVLYGRDVTIEDIVGHAKRYPMMAERQVVIVREAQDLSRTIDKLESYAADPTPTTVLIFCYKYKTLDKRRKLVKNLEKTGLVFESKKLWENQVGDWLKRMLQGKNYAIEPKALAMLVEFLGTDLGRIAKEVEKLQVLLEPASTITAKHIEDNIGFSKDFNNFELTKAIGQRDELKAYRIVQYFAENPKDNPMVVTTTMVFRYFSQLLQYHGLKDRSQKNVASVLGIKPTFVHEYTAALRHYPMKKVSAIIAALREIDTRSKGIGANMSQHDLLREMLVRIFS